MTRNERTSYRVSAYLTEKEIARLDKAAKSHGITRTQAIRNALSAKYGILFQARDERKNHPGTPLSQKPSALAIILTPSEKRQIDKAAQNHQLTLANLIRTAIADHYRIKIELRERPKAGAKT